MIIMFGLVLYTIVPAPEGDTEQLVFSIGFWYKYGHALFCKYNCTLYNYVVSTISNITLVNMYTQCITVKA